MTQHHPENELMKRKYLRWLKDAQGRDPSTLDQVAAAIARFERYTNWRDFRLFRPEHASAFKSALAKQKTKSGTTLSMATRCAILRHLKAFFVWLSREQGYRSKVSFADAAYFTPNANEARAAGAKRERPFPSVEQVQAAISAMPTQTVMERRDRSVLALILLTGARDGAVASLKMKHLNVKAKTVFFDARDVATKRAKTFTTRFFPVGDDAETILLKWEEELRVTELFGPGDPLFPGTLMRQSPSGAFEACGLTRNHWSDANPIRAIFKRAFNRIGLEAFNPHSVRNTLTSLAYRLDLSPEELKAWSQNLGHEDVSTTLSSYGRLPEGRQFDVIANVNISPRSGNDLERAVATINAFVQASR